MIGSLGQRIKQNERLKWFVHYLLIPKGQARPRRWVSWFVNPFMHPKGRGAVIRSSVRLDVLPFQPFQMGEGATIEDYCVVNNGVGAVSVGANSRVGIGSVMIGPVAVGNEVIIAQHVVMSGLNHSYEDIQKPIRKQPVTKAEVVIEDECWIGANAVVTAGVRVGHHSVVAAGSVVTKNVPPYSVVVGNPARVIKQYDSDKKEWVKVKPVNGTAQFNGNGATSAESPMVKLSQNGVPVIAGL
ncbi:acyltransferase [Spirosoma taeanense]|uniref:Acyltransferase n=1 Tax=Spirosoma taeanense TaxID=2735870 RepID=A0A6M5Y4Y1_9BACT|nr:acyltransferase [Spirosoma taeanense]QJW88163.1 acyltransferase [Spirosoma taeanense]